MRRLAHKITMITGAASGIGAATAELFANEGAVVAAVDVQDFSSPANESIITYRLDVSDEKTGQMLSATSSASMDGSMFLSTTPA